MSVTFTKQTPINSILQFLDIRGEPLIDGEVSVYKSNTSVLAKIYSDVELTTELDNPVTLGSYGEVVLFIEDNTSVDLVVKDVRDLSIIDYIKGAGSLDLGIHNENIDLTTVSSVGEVSPTTYERIISLKQVNRSTNYITTRLNENLTISPNGLGRIVISSSKINKNTGSPVYITSRFHLTACNLTDQVVQVGYFD